MRAIGVSNLESMYSRSSFCGASPKQVFESESSAFISRSLPILTLFETPAEVYRNSWMNSSLVGVLKYNPCISSLRDIFEIGLPVIKLVSFDHGTREDRLINFTDSHLDQKREDGYFDIVSLVRKILLISGQM